MNDNIIPGLITTPIKNKKTKHIIFIGFYTIIFIVLYISIGWYFVNKNYTMPKTIKKNQIPITCVAEYIVCDRIHIANRNNTMIYVYKISKAVTIDGNDITNVFAETSYDACPKNLQTSCWNYKKYYAKNKNDIEKKFYNMYFIWFLVMPMGYILFTASYLMCVYDLCFKF